jgi:hypothetical protein
MVYEVQHTQDMLTCASPLRFVIRTDAILATPRVVALPARTLPRTRLTLTDRPAMVRVVPTPGGRRIQRLREELSSRPATSIAPVASAAPASPVLDCRPALVSERSGAAWNALASLVLIIVAVAFCAAWTLH